MVKVSIIMPVYNSAQYLPHAIDSILAQDFDSFELILVDDGSLDNSGDICDDYAKSDQRVKVIHKQNGGICSARNAGLNQAQGEYIGFCDNDDEYLPHLLRDNYKIASDNDVDMIRYTRTKTVVDKDGKKWATASKVKDCIIEEKDFAQNFLMIRGQDSIWTGLYKKDIIEKHHIRFDESLKYGDEDTYFNLDFLMYCQRLGFNNHSYYNWIQRYSHSTSRSFHKEYLETFYGRLQRNEKFIKEKCGNGISVNDRAIYGTNAVYSMIDYFNLNDGSLTKKEKLWWLDKIRYSEFFNVKIDKKDMREVYRFNKRVGLTFSLFYKRRYRLLMFIVGNGSRILMKIRMKS